MSIHGKAEAVKGKAETKLEALIDELQVIYYDYDMDIRGTCPRTNWDDLEQGEAIGWHKALEQVISELEEIKEEYEK